MNFKLTKTNIIGLIILLIIIFFGIILHNYRDPKPTKVTEKITLVNNYNRFFTISNAGNKYITYLKNQDKDALMNLLNHDYIEVNNLNKNNMFNILEPLDENNEYTFEARKMYEEKLNKNIIKYYIYGHLSVEIMDTYTKPEDYYLIIHLDTENFTYFVTPYNGEIFMEET